MCFILRDTSDYTELIVLTKTVVKWKRNMGEGWYFKADADTIEYGSIHWVSVRWLVVGMEARLIDKLIRV